LPEEPPLHRAARVGDHDEIRRLVESGAAIDETFNLAGSGPTVRPQPATPLMLAAGTGEGATVDTVRLLLELGASTDPGPVGFSALSFACGGLGWTCGPGGDAARIAELLRAGSDPNVIPWNGEPALASAARAGDPERVRLLLEAGADPAPDPRDLQADYDHSRREYLRQQHEGDPDRCDPPPALMPVRCNRLALHRAAASRSEECVRMLLAAGVPAHADGADHSVLACATSAAMVADLIAAGADAHGGPGPFRISIIEAIARNRDVAVDERASMLRALARVGVDLDEGAPRSTAVSSRAMNGDAAGVEALLAAGADPRARNAMACACFSHSADRDAGIERVIDLLIAAGFDPNERDSDGYTPLHQALSPDAYGAGYQESDDINVAAASALIRHGASIDIVFPNFDGYGPLHVAALQCSAPAIEVLLEAGADPNRRAPDGKTALDVARAQVASGQEPSPRHGAAECVRALQAATGD
jgi:cytohesin